MFLITEKKNSLPFLLGFLILFIGLTLSKALTSLVTVYLLLLFIFQKQYKTAWVDLKESKSTRWFIVLILWMLISLVWSSDKTNGLKLVGANLNFFLWPILVILFKSQILQFKKWILWMFSTVTFLVSIIYFTHFQFREGFHDIREMSLFVSHIRFALMVNIATFIIIFFAIKENKKHVKFGYVLVIFWLLFYTYYSQVLSGILGLVGGFCFALIALLRKNKKQTRIFIIVSGFFLVIFGLFLVNFLTDQKTPSIHFSKLPKHTKLGNLYEHDIQSQITENGHYLYLYVCINEMEEAWDKRSNKKLSEEGPNGTSYRYALIRYLTSKGLTKDADGVSKLSDSDIKNVENGISSILELKTGLAGKFYSVKYEFSGMKNPNGHSILQRFEFWKTAKSIIQKKWLLGVGLGSSKEAFQKAYRSSNSILTPENRLESHNQFLSLWVSFGIIGLIIFLVWIGSVILTSWNSEWVIFSVIGVLVSSLLVEDTLSTLTGMTLFAFFIGLFQLPLTLESEEHIS